MNINDKTIVIQILDVWIRLTSNCWHGRMWNCYNSFTTFAEKRGLVNVTCSMPTDSVSLKNVVVAECTWLRAGFPWIETFSDIRNTLSCYLRSVINLIDICVFQWEATSLIGLHVTTPFMSMLLDYKVTLRELLDILPTLYKDLCSYETYFNKLDGSAVKSFTKLWQPPLKKNVLHMG